MAKQQKDSKGKQRHNPIKNLGKYAGHSPGRPRGTKNHDGLQVVLNMFKELISEKKNVERLRKAMQKEMERNPIGFYYKFAMPMMPKNVDITSGGKDLILQISEQYAPKINHESNGAK